LSSRNLLGNLVSETLDLCDIWGSYGSDYKRYCHMRCEVVCSGKNVSTFRCCYTATSLQGVVEQHTVIFFLSTYTLVPHTCIMKLFLLLVKYLFQNYCLFLAYPSTVF
jgi:hypothetical protein